MQAAPSEHSHRENQWRVFHAEHLEFSYLPLDTMDNFHQKTTLTVQVFVIKIDFTTKFTRSAFHVQPEVW